MTTPSYPWPALCRTFLLWFSFFSIGISDSVRGPTLLDLRDLISVETSEISTTFALRSLGGLLGSMATGLLLDRLSRASRYLILGLCFSVSGFCTAFLPHAPSLILMQLISFSFGFCNGIVHTASNVLLMDIWSGRNSSPYLYTLHFMFACGAFVAPLVARPFLRDEVEIAARDSWELWEIRSLYPMVGLTSLAVTPGYLICWMLERPKDKSKDVLVEKEDANANGIGCRRWLLVGLMAVYYFAFIGVESSLRTFTSAFGVSSSLKLTRAQGSDLLAFFYLTFAASRALVIPLSIWVAPGQVVLGSLLLVLLSSVSLSVWATHSHLILGLAVAMAGAGVASVFASGMLWVKEQMEVNNRISSVFTMSCSISSQLYALLIGSYIESWPMVFPHTITASACGLLLAFLLSYWLSASVKRNNTNSITKRI